MPEYVEIAVNVPRVTGVFHYHCPAELENHLVPGHLVMAPFGQQVVQGVVLRGIDEPQVRKTRPISALLDQIPVLTRLQLQLAQHLAESTIAPLAACVGLMLPPGIGQLAEMEYSLNEFVEVFEGKLSTTQEQVMELLRSRGPLRGRQLDRALPRRNWRSAMSALADKGLTASKPVLPLPSARPKTVRTAELAIAPEKAAHYGKELGSNDNTRTRRAKILAALARERQPVEANWLYAESGGKREDLYVLEEMDLVRLSDRESIRDPLSELPFDPRQLPRLSADQQRVWDAVHKAMLLANEGQVIKPILLHGVTSSGKTEIYLQAVARCLTLGRMAIVLVPEIALTPQTTRRFLARFPGEVGVLHSELSEGERYDTWRRARAGHLKVIVGPRSALFAPLPQIGLVVVDESHDSSYYEAGQLPHYHARTVAATYAKLAGAVCLMGSATPDVGSYYLAQRDEYQLLELPARILAHRETALAHRRRLGGPVRYAELGEELQGLEMPPVNVIDMRAELRRGNRSIFSQALRTKLAEILEHEQQAILFLNRRGSATYVFCRECGESLRCPNCENPLTQHLDGGQGRLVCHHCAYSRLSPKICPNCGSSQIRHYGTGTESVEAEVHKLFPESRTLRWDYESTRKKGAHERILRSFAEGQADVLIGTQMLAKGLDLPLVTLVGVVLADVGLNLPDFRAAERVFQVLTQVAGRAGRSPLGGHVLLQTFQPEHYAIQAAASHDYHAFFAREIAERQSLRYPPFSELVRMEYRHADAQKAEKEARSMAKRLSEMLVQADRRATDLIGPAPCFYTRLNREYRWQLVLRGPQPASLLQGVKLADWRVEVNPIALL